MLTSSWCVIALDSTGTTADRMDPLVFHVKHSLPTPESGIHVMQLAASDTPSPPNREGGV